MITRSKSSPQLLKPGADELSILSEVDSEDKEIEIDELSEPSENKFLFSSFQISLLASGFSSIFLNKSPHIMNKICYAFKNALSLSPILIQSPSNQLSINTLLILPSLCIIFCGLFVKFGVLTTSLVMMPLRFFSRIIFSLMTVYLLHFGESFEYYLFSCKTREAKLVLSYAVFAYVLYSAAVFILSQMHVLDFHGKNALYFLLLQVPMIITFASSFCSHMFKMHVGPIVFNAAFFVISSLASFYIGKTEPFKEKKWNKRLVATNSGCMIFSFVNFLNYLKPEVSSYSITFGFILVCACIIGEFGKLPVLSLQKRIRKTERRQAYSEGCDDQVSQAPRRPFIKIEIQDICAIAFFTTGSLSMIYFNVMAAKMMPTGEPLPDFIHNMFDVGKEIRSAPAFQQMQFSNLVCMVAIIGLFIIAIIAPEVTNARKVYVVYGLMCFVRSVAFCVTSMPAPCSGLPNCPCGEIEELNKIRKMHPLKIALTWSFGAGMFAKLPQCGDLIISGHTMFMWMTFKWIFQSLRRMVKRTTVNKVRIICIFLFIMAVSYITLARNHYTVDVWFGFFVAELIFDVYSLLEEKANNNANNSLIVRGMRWLESRTFPLNKMDYEEDENHLSNNEI